MIQTGTNGALSFFSSIRGKIILQMMLVSLIPIIIIAAIVYVSMFNSQQSASDSVDETRDEMQENVVAVSLENQAEAMALELTGMAGDQILDLIQVMSTPTIMQLAMGMGDASVAKMYLDGQVQILDDLTGFTMTDNNGVVLVTTEQDISIGEDLSSKDWWDDDNFIAIEPTSDNKITTMRIWLPVSNPFNPEEVLGRLIGSMKSESETATLEYAEKLDQGRMIAFYGGMLVADSGDSMRVHEDEITLSYIEETAFQAVAEADAAIKPGEPLTEVSGFIIDDEAEVVAAYYRPGAEQTAEVMPSVLSSSIGIDVENDTRSASDQAAIVIMQQPKEAAFAPISSLESLEDDLEDNTSTTIMLLIGVFITVTVIVLVISIGLNRLITNPIMKLHRGVEYVMEGNLDYRIGSEGSDEVGQLSLAFDHMTDNIQKSQEELKEYSQNLEANIEERTEELRATAEKMQLIIESMSDGLAVVDMTGMIVEANTALAKLHGFDWKSDVIGKNNMELIAEKDHERLMADMGETFEQRTPGLREYTMVRSDGSEYEAEMATVALTDKLGNLTGAMAVIRDVTERKEAEQQILETKTKLEAYATDLERSNRELDDFAYIASHDLKEPLRGIYNFSSFLIEDYSEKLDDEGKSKLQTLMKLTQRLEAYLNDLLYYSRAGRSEIAKEEVDMAAILRDILDSLRPNIEEQGVKVTVADDMPTIKCDRSKISEAIRNLVSNAIKYNDKDEKRVEIGWQKGEEGSPVFYVRDNGIGIRQKHLDKIFKIFTRLHAKEEYGGGTGAGLTMARKIFQRHGGDIWVESQEGEGTTFYFTMGK